MEEEIRELRDVLKEHDNKIKVLEGIQRECNHKKESSSSGKHQRKRSGGSSLDVSEIYQQKEMPISQRTETVENIGQGTEADVGDEKQKQRVLVGPEEQRYGDIGTEGHIKLLCEATERVMYTVIDRTIGSV